MANKAGCLKAGAFGALVALTFVVSPIGPAGAAPPCGSTITSSIALDADIGPCPNGGLRVTASNITIDLRGRRIFGTGQPGDGTGVHLFRVSNVTVKNGTVSNFDMGVAIEGGTNNTVTFVTARDNIGSNTTNGGDGIAILSSTNNKILDNSTINNGALSGIGVYSVPDSAHPRNTGGPASGNLIQRNQVLNNIASRFGDVTTTDNDGIRVEPNSPDNFILDNTVVGNGLDGIVLFVGSNNNVIRGNSVHRNGLYRTTARRGNGIGLQSLPGTQGATGNTIENNLVTGNGDNGIVLRGPRGGALGAVNNIVRFNRAYDNAVLPLLGPAFGPAFDLNDNNPDCDNNLWRGNQYKTAEPPCTRL